MAWTRFKEINRVLKVYSECSIKNLTQHKAAAQDFIKHPGCLLLQGDCGTGKTYFMFTLIRELFEQRKLALHQVAFLRAKNMSDRMEEEYRQYGTTKATIESYIEDQILFIDDFGVQSRAERMERDFYELCDVRLGNSQPTVFSTNLTDEEIKETFGGRIASRLKICEKLLFNGEDRRSYF